MSGGRESPNGTVLYILDLPLVFNSRATSTRAAQRAWRPGHTFLLLTKGGFLFFTRSLSHNLDSRSDSYFLAEVPTRLTS